MKGEQIQTIKDKGNQKEMLLVTKTLLKEETTLHRITDSNNQPSTSSPTMHETPKKASKIQMKAAVVHVWIPKFSKFAKLGTNPLKTSRQTVTGLTVGIGKAATGGSTQFALIYIIPTTMIVKKVGFLGSKTVFPQEAYAEIRKNKMGSNKQLRGACWAIKEEKNCKVKKK